MSRPPDWMRVTPWTLGLLVYASWQAGHTGDALWWLWVAMTLVPVVWHVAATQR